MTKITLTNNIEVEKDDLGFMRLSSSTPNKEITEDEQLTLLQHEAERLNNMRVANKYFDCPKCKNKGFISHVDQDEMRVVHINCECNNRKRICQQLDAIGVYEFAKTATFENYKTNTPWQERSKNIAMSFLKNYKGKWFFMGGNVGCGKTHLCTAILLGILQKDPYTSMNYFKWDDSFDDLANNDPYGETMKALKSCDVLYLDDFFRPLTGGTPRYMEVRKAKEIMDYRYMNKKTTIISSELTLDQIVEIDQAIGSRITQMSSKTRIVYSQSLNKTDRNVRLHPELIQ